MNRFCPKAQQTAFHERARWGVMFKAFKEWIEQMNCVHAFRYSRSKPGTLVCKHCRKRKPKPRI